MNKYISFLGLTKKAGKCIEGYNKCEDALRYNKCHLIILSDGVSDNTKEKFLRMANNKNVPIITGCDKYELAYILGRDEINVIGVSDESMANRLLQLWEGTKQN